MNNFTNIVRDKVLKAVSNYDMLGNTREIVVGFSGGADSVCLLHVLNSFKGAFNYSIKAVHVNHGIRGEEAKADENFAKEFCTSFDIPFCLVSVNCIEEANKNKESVEECGRRLRYESFNNFCSEWSKIATAHNANDNAETVIFNITRGSSVKGLCGIPFVRDNIIRPLLYCSRDEIEGYCRENNLQFVTDSTNLSVDYTRNKIRHLVLPVLQEINPSYIEAFSSLSNNAEITTAFLNENAEELLKKADKGDFVYNREILLNSDEAIVKEMLYLAFFTYSNKALDNKKINSLYNLLIEKGRCQLYGDIFAEVKKNYLRFYKIQYDSSNAAIEIESLPFETEFGGFLVKLEKISDNSKIVNQISCGDVINCNELSGKLVLRTRKAGDSFTFPKRNVTKSLKKLFNEENIPIEIRDSLPVLADDAGVVWVQGFGVTKRCCALGSCNNIVLVRGKNNDR